ncbi:hypothetical protein E2C01_074211 [Portunus trituberculatus]|uniref:Uncharacterized protein n=1 Tax=Portunus trituberculatus TaxID=210409 RepID=A0A5B7IGI3_PORTR|nr:hypothetical protein [Portunus trituberculatus]
MDKDFSGFRNEQGNVMSSLMDKQDQLIMENTDLKLRLTECEKVSANNQELKEDIQEIKKQ